MTLYTIQGLADKNAKLNQWPQSYGRIRNLIYQLKKYEIEGGLERIGRRILIKEDAFYEAISKLPAQGLKRYKQKDMHNSEIVEELTLDEHKEKVIRMMKRETDIFYSVLGKSTSIKDMKYPIINYLWGYIRAMGALLNESTEDKHKP